MPGPDHLFTQSITWAPISGRDAYGKATLGSHSSGVARVQATLDFVRDYAGDSVQAAFLLYVPASNPIQRTYRVWLPGDNTSSDAASRRVIAVWEGVDGVGSTRFRKVWVS